MSQIHSLTGLTIREAIADALYRASVGMDKNDWELFKSALAGDEATMTAHAGEGKPDVNKGLSQIRAKVFDPVGALDTTHMTSNLRINVEDGANVASLTCTVMNQHCPAGEGKRWDGPKFMGGGEYSIDLVKDDKDGLWKIKNWELNVTWTQGDPAILELLRVDRSQLE